MKYRNGRPAHRQAGRAKRSPVHPHSNATAYLSPVPPLHNATAYLLPVPPIQQRPTVLKLI
ncbi:MAG: hypothetical protein FWG68_07640 [Defluviitaleaceae bacterium]|nr:hypothetical protein [Defluviitaleaceae bacterium]